MKTTKQEVVAVLEYIFRHLPTQEERQAAVSAIEALQADYGMTEKQACDLVFSRVFNSKSKQKFH